MPKGRFPKLKGSIYNICIDSDDIANVLPGGADSNGLLIVQMIHIYIYMYHISIIYIYIYIYIYTLVLMNQNNVSWN